MLQCHQLWYNEWSRATGPTNRKALLGQAGVTLGWALGPAKQEMANEMEKKAAR